MTTCLKLPKTDLGRLFSVSTRTISTWQQQDGFPQPEKKGRANTYDASLLLHWWHGQERGKLIEDGDGTTLDITAAPAKLAVARTSKTTVETELKESQLMHLLSGGVTPADRAKDFVLQAEAAVNDVFTGMQVEAPTAYLETEYHAKLAELHAPTYRLRCILDEYRLMAREELSDKLNTLLERFMSSGVGELETAAPPNPLRKLSYGFPGIF